MRSWVSVVGLLVLGSSAGCGGNARRATAESALSDTRAALLDLDTRTSGSDAAEVRNALDRAQTRLTETEHALELWSGSTGSLAYERMAACLGAALDTLRSALVDAGMEVTMELESAEVMLGSTTERTCAHPAGGD